MISIVLMVIIVVLFLINNFSYKYLNRKIRSGKKWDLNICAGRTDGGGLNADVKKYIELPNFILVNDIYHLPFSDKQFMNVLCAHTMEHVENPELFFKELQRVGENIVLVLPPIWDIGAMVNLFEHKWIFITLKSEHSELPPKMRLPFARLVHKYFGQIYHA